MNDTPISDKAFQDALLKQPAQVADKLMIVVKCSRKLERELNEIKAKFLTLQKQINYESFSQNPNLSVK